MATLSDNKCTERTSLFLASAAARAAAGPHSPKLGHWTHAFFELYSDEPLVRRQALAFAYALSHEPVVIHDDEYLVGQTYQSGACDLGGTGFDPRWEPFDAAKRIEKRVAAEIPELLLLGGAPESSGSSWLSGVPRTPGHIGWRYDWILDGGIEALLRRVDALEPTADAQGMEFLGAVRIVLEAVLDWADRHVAELEARLPSVPPAAQAGWLAKIDRCRRVPRHGARTFREALQSFHFSYLATIFENPHGGNGPGRLDYFLWPYLERDLANGVETLDSAREWIDELFVRFHERLLFRQDGTVETIVVAGCHSDGRVSFSPLSRIMVESIGALGISHPSVYIRMPEDAPDDVCALAAADLHRGGNRAQIVSDAAIISAMTRNGEIAVEDARMYMCGGCMEISPHGANGDLLFTGFFNTPKVLELVINGGCCMNTGACMLPGWNRTLTDFGNFEELYEAFEQALEYTLRLTFRCMDIVAEEFAIYRPRFLVSAQVQDCLARGRGINAGGARYEDYGSTPLGIPNIGDSLSAIRQAVFEEKFVSAADLLTALRTDFAGSEILRRRLAALPKFGQGDAVADRMVDRVVGSVCDAYDGYRNRFGRRVKPMVMTFMMAPAAGRALGATPDGRRAKTPIAQGMTPQSSAMTAGITTAIRSANSLELTRFAGGASSMWDLDPAYATEPNLKALLCGFLATGGQMFQGNTTSVDELVAARRDPASHRGLMVRIGGYSGRFVDCSAEVQDEIIARRRHGG